MDHCYIAYNTFTKNQNITIFSSNNNTFKKNIWKATPEESSSVFEDNYEGEKLFPTITDYSSLDSDVYNATMESIRSTYGAFAGDSPYVLSGVPAGPVIENLVVPATVELGSKLNVTIKVGVQP